MKAGLQYHEIQFASDSSRMKLYYNHHRRYRARRRFGLNQNWLLVAVGFLVLMLSVVKIYSILLQHDSYYNYYYEWKSNILNFLSRDGEKGAILTKQLTLHSSLELQAAHRQQSLTKTYYLAEDHFCAYSLIRALNELGWKKVFQMNQAQMIWTQHPALMQEEALKPWQQWNHLPKQNAQLQNQGDVGNTEITKRNTTSLCRMLPWSSGQSFHFRMYYLVASADPWIVLVPKDGGFAWIDNKLDNTWKEEASVDQVATLIRKHYYHYPTKILDVDPWQHVQNQCKQAIATIANQQREQQPASYSSSFAVYATDFQIDENLHVWQRSNAESVMDCGENYYFKVHLHEKIHEGAIRLVQHIQQIKLVQKDIDVHKLEKDSSWEIVYAADKDKMTKYHYNGYEPPKKCHVDEVKRRWLRKTFLKKF